MVKQSGKVPQVKCRSSTFPFLFFSASQYRQWKLLLLDCSLNKAMNKKMFMWLNQCHDNSMKSHKNWTKRNKLKVNLKKKSEWQDELKGRAFNHIMQEWCLITLLPAFNDGDFFMWALSSVSLDHFCSFSSNTDWLIQHYIPTGLWRSMGQQCNKL